jgi:SAM-dependent methyltransferase
MNWPLGLALCLAIALVLAPLIYPGELSHVRPGLNRWLYDRAARSYDRKWRSRAYRDPKVEDAVIAFAKQSVARSGIARVLDLGCGTGRGTRQLIDVLPASTRFIGVDYSNAMLGEFRKWLREQDASVSRRVELHQADLADRAVWSPADAQYGLVLMLEVGEFTPHFMDVLTYIAAVLPPGGGLIATRPAGIWPLFFPGRSQTRQGFESLLDSLGFAEPRYLKWRSRYEMVLAQKA